MSKVLCTVCLASNLSLYISCADRAKVLCKVARVLSAVTCARRVRVSVRERKVLCKVFLVSEGSPSGSRVLSE